MWTVQVCLPEWLPEASQTCPRFQARRQGGSRGCCQAEWAPPGTLWPSLFMVKFVEETGLRQGCGWDRGAEDEETTFIICEIVSKTLSTQIIGRTFSPEIRE